MLSVQDQPGGQSLLRLVEYLLAKFPVRTELDYFGLCRADPKLNLLPIAAYDKFRSISASIDMLVAEGVVKANHFRDGSLTFHWDVVLTPVGFNRAVRALDATRMIDRDDRDLLLHLCSGNISGLSKAQ